MIATKSITTTEQLAEHLRTSSDPVFISDELRRQWMLNNIQVKRPNGNAITPKWVDESGGIWRVKR